MSYLGVLDSNFEKPLSYLTWLPSNLFYSTVWCNNKKSLNLGPKIPYLGNLGFEFENNIVIFEISALDFI